MSKDKQNEISCAISILMTIMPLLPETIFCIYTLHQAEHNANGSCESEGEATTHHKNYNGVSRKIVKFWRILNMSSLSRV